MMNARRWSRTGAVWGAVLLGVAGLGLAGCSASDDASLCEAEGAIGFAHAVCLVFEDDGAFSAEQRQDIATVTRETVAAIQRVMPTDNLVIRVGNDPGLVIPEIGVGGFNPNAEEVRIGINPRFSNFDQVLNQDLAFILAHEVHHAKQRRSVGYGASLLQAAVSEGLADHFAIEITGAAPPLWAVALTGEDLETWTTNAQATWNNPSYNHAEWFLGASPTIPRWVGYAIGFELVRAFLAEHPERVPSDLDDEPATSFSP